MKGSRFTERARGATFSALTGAYGLVNRTGLLETGVGRRAFSGAYFIYKRLLEDPFSGLVRRHPDLLAGGHVIDVGANIGYTAITFSRALSPGLLVHAFEPDSSNFALLVENLSRAGEVGRRVVPIRAAVGESNGEIAFHHNPVHHGDHHVILGATEENLDLPQVPLLTVDSYLEQRGVSPATVRFVKIDVQGYEAAVVRGMAGLLGEGRPAVAIEYDPDRVRELGGDPEELLTSLLEGDRRPFLLKKSGALEPLTPASIEERAAEREWIDLLFSADDLR